MYQGAYYVTVLYCCFLKMSTKSTRHTIMFPQNVKRKFGF